MSFSTRILLIEMVWNGSYINVSNFFQVNVRNPRCLGGADGVCVCTRATA